MPASTRFPFRIPDTGRQPECPRAHTRTSSISGWWAAAEQLGLLVRGAPSPQHTEHSAQQTDPRRPIIPLKQVLCFAVTRSPADPPSRTPLRIPCRPTPRTLLFPTKAEFAAGVGVRGGHGRGTPQDIPAPGQDPSLHTQAPFMAARRMRFPTASAEPSCRRCR